MSYVQLTRAEFEDWLGTMGFHQGDWRLDRGGVYHLFLSPTVAIEINSTTGSRDEVMGVGKASMSLRLISRINARTLNKKAMGQSHFARTINWRDNWKKGVERMKDAYVKAKDFYDTIASIEDYDAYQREMLGLIESKPNWQQDKFLTDLRDRLQRGGVLSPKQRDALKRVPAQAPAPRAPEPQREDPRIQSLRELYSKARNDADGWTMDFAKSLGQQLAAGRDLSPRQTQILEDKLRAYRVRMAALVGTDTATILDEGLMEPYGTSAFEEAMDKFGREVALDLLRAK